MVRFEVENADCYKYIFGKGNVNHYPGTDFLCTRESDRAEGC